MINNNIFRILFTIAIILFLYNFYLNKEYFTPADMIKKVESAYDGTNLTTQNCSISNSLTTNSLSTCSLNSDKRYHISGDGELEINNLNISKNNGGSGNLNVQGEVIVRGRKISDIINHVKSYMYNRWESQCCSNC